MVFARNRRLLAPIFLDGLKKPPNKAGIMLAGRRLDWSAHEIVSATHTFDP